LAVPAGAVAVVVAAMPVTVAVAMAVAVAAVFVAPVTVSTTPAASTTSASTPVAYRVTAAVILPHCGKSEARQHVGWASVGSSIYRLGPWVPAQAYRGARAAGLVGNGRAGVEHSAIDTPIEGENDGHAGDGRARRAERLHDERLGQHAPGHALLFISWDCAELDHPRIPRQGEVASAAGGQ
jgi:hypothetical protein